MVTKKPIVPPAESPPPFSPPPEPSHSIIPSLPKEIGGWLGAFLQVFQILTLTKVLLFGLLMFIGIAGYVLYTNQNTIITGWIVRTKVVPAIIPAPTGQLRKDMIVFIDNNADLVGIQVVDVDLGLNTRTTIWYYTDEPEFKVIFDKYLVAKIGPTPWLSTEGPADYLALTLSSAVNSVPICIALADTLFPKRVPEMPKYVTDLCVTPIPPPYASFSGYISVWLKRPFTTEEKQELINQLRVFSARLQPAIIPWTFPGTTSDPPTKDN